LSAVRATERGSSPSPAAKLSVVPGSRRLGSNPSTREPSSENKKAHVAGQF